MPLSIHNITLDLVRQKWEAPPHKGSLVKTPAYALILALSQRQYSGKLVLEKQKRVKHIFFRNGIICGIRSNLVLEGIDIILRRHTLSQHDIDALTQFSQDSFNKVPWDERILRRALSMSLLHPKQAQEALILQAYERLYNAFGWFEGFYALVDHEESNEKQPIHIDVSELFAQLEYVLFRGNGPFHTVSKANKTPFIGQLRSLGGATTLAYFCLKNATGRLSFVRGPKRKMFRLKEGRVHSAHSSLESETLEKLILRWNIVSSATVLQANKDIQHKAQNLKEWLLEKAFLSAEELEKATKLLHWERCLEAFAWRSGDYNFSGHAKDELTPMIGDNTTLGMNIIHPEVQRISKSLKQLEEKSSKRCFVLLTEKEPAALEALQNELGLHGYHFSHKTLWIRHSATSKTSISDLAAAKPELASHVATISSQEKSWASFAGQEALNQAFEKLCLSYDRIIWLEHKTNIARSLLGNATLLIGIERSSTAKSWVQQTVKDIKSQHIQGFVFFETKKLNDQLNK